jgi:hypothetical protein
MATPAAPRRTPKRRLVRGHVPNDPRETGRMVYVKDVHPDDVALCLELDRFPFAMAATLEDSLMVLRPYAVPRLAVDSPGRGF